MANEDKKDFNVMLHDSKDMPKFQTITDEKVLKNMAATERISPRLLIMTRIYQNFNTLVSGYFKPTVFDQIDFIKGQREKDEKLDTIAFPSD